MAMHIECKFKRMCITSGMGHPLCHQFMSSGSAGHPDKVLATDRALATGYMTYYELS